MGSIVKVKRKRKLFGHFARTQQKGGSRCVEFFFSLNMDGLENSGEGESEGSRGHANIGQASLNFDCAHPRERREGKGQEKKV